MLTVEKLSRRPVTFRRLTGVDVTLFQKMSEKIRPLWEKRRDDFECRGRRTVCSALKITSSQCCFITDVM